MTTHVTWFVACDCAADRVALPGPIAGAAGAVGDGVSGLFKPKKRGKHAAGEPQREVEAGADEDVTGE
jgi:hypothetical protein